MNESKCTKCGMERKTLNGVCIDTKACAVKILNDEWDAQERIEAEKEQRRKAQLAKAKEENDNYGGAIPNPKFQFSPIRNITQQARNITNSQYNG